MNIIDTWCKWKLFENIKNDKKKALTPLVVSI